MDLEQFHSELQYIQLDLVDALPAMGMLFAHFQKIPNAKILHQTNIHQIIEEDNKAILLPLLLEYYLLRQYYLGRKEYPKQPVH
jgi:hypothetical protein